MYTPENQGDFFAAYNDQGILQFAHLFSTSTLNSASSLGLDLMENRLLITGRVDGYPDMDVTEEQFYPPQNYASGTKFISIYEIENGLELNGLYFLPGDGTDGYLAKNYLKGE